jgi:glycosyltransferase involved in cell wall biosynthesis
MVVQKKRVHPLRILFFVAEYHRFSGSQRSLLQLLRKLPDAGVEILALFPGEGICSDKFRDAGIPVEVLRAPDPLHQFGRTVLEISRLKQITYFAPLVLNYSRRIAGFMKKNRIDILHCNTTRSIILSGLIPRLMGYPVVWHVRGQLTATVRLNPLAERIATRIVVVANALKKIISASAAKKTITIYNGVDVHEIRHELEQANEDEQLKEIDAGQFVVLAVAAVVPFKGLHHLVEAARKFPEEAKMLFLVVGPIPDQHYYEYLQHLICTYGLKNFRFLGFKENPFPFYRRAQIVVLPTVEHDFIQWNGSPIRVTCGEGLPRCILEAMALGKAVVVSDAAGIGEQILHRQCGLVVPQRDPGAIASAILELWQNPETASAFGQAALARVREVFGAEQGSIKMKAVFEELLETNQEA